MHLNSKYRFMSNYKVFPFLLLSLFLTLLMAISEGDIPSIASLLEYKYIASICTWAFSLFVILSLAYIVNAEAAKPYRYIFFASFVIFLLLVGQDSAGAGEDSMFFEMKYPANGLCIIFYGGILFAFFSFVNMLDNLLVRYFLKVKN